MKYSRNDWRQEEFVQHTMNETITGSNRTPVTLLKFFLFKIVFPGKKMVIEPKYK